MAYKDTQGTEYAYATAIIENPDRTQTQLYNLARGHAISQGRNYITVQDIAIVSKVVLSTASIERTTLFDLLIANKGKLTSSQIEESLNCSRPTVLGTMTELKAVGLVEMTSQTEYSNAQIAITLKEQFNWFLSDEFIAIREGFIPLDNTEFLKPIQTA